MNDAEIDRIVAELAQHTGSPFTNAWQSARDRVVLGLGDGTLLLLVPRGPFARLHTVPSRPPNPSRPFSFQGACRAHLHGPLLSVHRVDEDRIVRIVFARGALELRLTGRSGGLWLLDGAQVVAAHDGPAPAALPPPPPRGAHADQDPRFGPEAGESWNDAARRTFEGQEREHGRRERLGRVERAIRRAVDRNTRLLEHLAEDLDRADEAPRLRHHADLLAAYLHHVRRGDRAAVVEDWDSGQTVNLALDPARTPAANLERMYHQAKRLERMADRVLARIGHVEAEQRWLLATAPILGTLDADALAAIEQRLPRVVDQRPRDRDRPAPGHVGWVGPGGRRIFVGRNARGNRILTFQVAKGHDWWMHLRDRPGAHLVIPTPKGQSPPLELLLAAAQIALTVGQFEVGEAAEVQYTRVRDVRAISGEEGLVTVRGERVLRVVRDPAALAGWMPIDDD